jgi:aryl-alcohol dehydrogenase-like predicted oxidoreductase
MEYVQFGSTEFKVSRLALGAERMGYSARFRRGHCKRSRANRLLALTTKGVDAALLAPRVALKQLGGKLPFSAARH